MYCSNRVHETKENARFCTYCGQSVEQEVETINQEENTNNSEEEPIAAQSTDSLSTFVGKNSHYYQRFINAGIQQIVRITPTKEDST